MASKLLSPVQQNFVRLGIGCVDLIKLVFKDILRINIQPEDLYCNIKKCAHLTSGKNELRPEQKKICFFPLPLVPDYEQFDVSLLYTLIRNLCHNLKPTQGWGKIPTTAEIQIGDDIERLRLFRNSMFAHLKSSAVPDTEFALRWKDLKIILPRAEAFVISKGYTANYEKELTNIEKSDFGYGDMEKYKILLEGMMYLLGRPEKDIPSITISGEDKVLCGEMAVFEAKVENPPESTTSQIVWHRVRKNGTDRIDIHDEKYEGSTNQRLMIQKVSKDDRGVYQAAISWVFCGQTHDTTSNSIFFDALGELPNLKKLIVKTGAEGITIHCQYEVPQDSPEIRQVVWTKNGGALNIVSEKYIAGGLRFTYLTIASPTSADAGTYTCIVTNAVGDASESILLDIPNATIRTEVPVIYGNEIRITSNTKSCPPCEGALWEKSTDSVIFQKIDVCDPKYYGSRLDPNNPVLVFKEVKFDDKLYYRLHSWNKIGDCWSNTLFIDVTGGPPKISNCSPQTNIKKHSVSLICEVSLYENAPSVQEVVWMKNNYAIDIARSGGKYAGGSIHDATMVINDVNEFDAGLYLCKVSNASGPAYGNIIVLGVPELQIQGPEIKEHGTFVFTATIKSSPEVFSVQWSTKNEETDEYTPIDVNKEEYRGTSNSVRHPELVIRQFPLRTVIVKIQAQNFIGISTQRIHVPSSSKNKPIDSYSATDVNKEEIGGTSNYLPKPIIKKAPLHNQSQSSKTAKTIKMPDNPANTSHAEDENKVNRMAAFFKKKGSTIRFNNLRLALLRGIHEAELNSLKDSLKVTMGCSVENVLSVRDFLTFLIDEKIFQERNVIMMQYLLRSIERPDLELKCVEYAKENPKALCYFDEINPPENGYKHVHLHVALDVEGFGDLDSLKETVAAIVGCDENCIELVAVQQENSFVFVFSMKEKFAQELFKKELNRLKKYNIDWIKIGNEVIYITQDIPSSITVPGINTVNHISWVRFKRLWVSDQTRLLQVDNTGQVIQEIDIDVAYYPQTGAHSTGWGRNLVFINGQKVQMMMSDRIITTLFRLPECLLCVHSSHINSDTLVGYESGVARYNWRRARLIKLVCSVHYPTSITENKNEDIWVSDIGRGKVVVMDSSGQYRFNYSGQHPSNFKPGGICTNIFGQVLVCDQFQSSVDLVDQDGQFLRLLLTREHGLYRPTALCVDDDHNLYVGEIGSNKIRVYKYQHETDDSKSSIVEST